MEKSKGDGLYNILRSVFIIGAIVLVLWYAASCADSAEEKAREQREEEDEKLVRDTREEVLAEVYDELPPLGDIFFDAYDPDDLESDYENGNITAEEVLEQYRALYNAIGDAMAESDFYR